MHRNTSMASDPTVIKQGYLHKLRNERETTKLVWQSLFFVLHGPDKRNAARLDWYDTQEQFLQSPGKRKALFIEEIKDCHKISPTRESKELYGPSAKYLLMIQTYRPSVQNYILKCSSRGLLTEWHDHLNALHQHVHTLSQAIRTAIPDKLLDQNDIYNPISIGSSSSYEVQVDDTAAAVHCELHGVYLLLLSQQHITLAQLDTSTPVITWMYKHIRRFGYCDKSLTIEGGSKCGIGQGLFIFITDQGDELMRAINERMNLCKISPESSEDYSYISFRESMTEDSTTKKESTTKEESAASDTFPKYSKVEDRMSGPKVDSPLEKPSLPQKPVINIAALSDPGPQSSQMQPKISEVLSQLPHEIEQGKEDGVYGYSHLDLKGTAAKANLAEDLENPYGEQLVQKIKNSK